MATTTYEGVFKKKDASGNILALYPDTKTDTTLSVSGKAADAATVGDKLTWKGLSGEKTGNSSTISLSDITWNELMIKVNVKNANLVIPLFIPKIAVLTTNQQFRGGYWINEGNGAQVNLSISSSSLKLNDVYLNGSDVTADTIWGVYYR